MVVELHNKADGPDWTWIGLADSAEAAVNKALAHCGGPDYFDVGEVDMQEEVSFRVETGELGETLQYRERKK